jgi:glycosyltransferase involved in cell wall biosynthesis
MIDLTVIICAYNAQVYIERTLLGFLNQTLKEYSLLVIDDCSTDNTAQIVKSFILEYKLINWSIVTLPKNVGLAASRKYGEQNVETEYVIDFDADDIPLPEMLEKQVVILRNDQKCMAVGSYCSYIDENDNQIYGGFYIGPTNKEQFFSQASTNKLIFLHHPMYRRDIASQVGGRSLIGFPDGQIRYQDMCEDLDLWMRMSDFYIYNNYFIVIPEPLFLYRKHTSAMSSNANLMNQRIRHIKFNLLRRRNGLPDISFIDYNKTISNLQKIKNYMQDKSSNYYKISGSNYLNKNYTYFLFYLFSAFVYSPGYVGKKIRGNFLMRNKKNNSYES